MRKRTPALPCSVQVRSVLRPLPIHSPRVVSRASGPSQHRTKGTQQHFVLRPEAAARLRPLGSPMLRPLPQSRQVRPVIHAPDLGRDLPAAFILGFLAFAAAVATARRRARHTASGTQSQQMQRSRLDSLAPSVQKALRATLNGLEGALTRALRRSSAARSGGARVAHVLVALEQVGREAGAPPSLLNAIRLVVEGAEKVDVIVEATRLRAARIDDLAQRLGMTLGVQVTIVDNVERDGTPLITLTVNAATLEAPADLRPHPLPLLVPLGATAEGAVIHVNLARTGGLLVAGGGQSIAATLLASAVYQAPPDALRLLVASDDDELRKSLPQLDHLDAPPADARDSRAVAALIDQAYTLVLDRYEQHGALIAPQAGLSSIPPVPCLFVLAGIEGLDDAALDRLDAIAHTGSVCGVHLLATTGNPAALAASGTLALFHTRLARRLTAADNALICPDSDTSTLGPHEVVLFGLGTPSRLSAFTLTPPEIREVFSTVAAATVPTLPVVEMPASLPSTPVPLSGPEPATESPAEQGTSDAQQRPPLASTGGADATDSLDGEEEPSTTADDAAEEVDAAADGATSASPAPVDSPPVRLDLLGGTLVFMHGQPITVLPRERSLLAALAVLGPRPVPRSDLIAALFADDTDGSNTLSHALTDLRAALRAAGLPRAQARDFVRKTSGGYLLNKDLIAVDLWHVDALLREAEGRDEAEAGALLAEAFALYHGPLCGGEALNFVEEHAYRWMRRVASALYRLADYYHETGDLKAALHWIHRLLLDEPYDDHAHQLALNLLAELGAAEELDAHMAEMQEQYKAAKQKLDPYTLRLYEQLRRKLRGDSTTKAG